MKYLQSSFVPSYLSEGSWEVQDKSRTSSLLLLVRKQKEEEIDVVILLEGVASKDGGHISLTKLSNILGDGGLADGYGDSLLGLVMFS